MIDPSSEWTDDERKAVVIAITEEMQASVRDAKHSEVCDWANRIDLTLTQRASFLEASRNYILRGEL